MSLTGPRLCSKAGARSLAGLSTPTIASRRSSTTVVRRFSAGLAIVSVYVLHLRTCISGSGALALWVKSGNDALMPAMIEVNLRTQERDMWLLLSSKTYLLLSTHAIVAEDVSNGCRTSSAHKCVIAGRALCTIDSILM